MSDYLPENVVAQILLNLPIKPLIKCTTVCKSWKSLIRSSPFINAHLSRRSDDFTIFLFTVKVFSGDRFYDRCMLHRPETGESKTIFHPPLLRQEEATMFPEIDVQATCNGLVLLSRGSHSYIPYCAIIWNPTIRRYINLPSPIVARWPYGLVDYHAFGHDVVTNDYKVLRIIPDRKDVDVTSNAPCEVEVYSLARGGWMSLGDDVVPRGIKRFDNGILLKNAMHWLQYGNNVRNSIVVFDMHNEIFSEMVAPNAIGKLHHSTCMSRYEESLAIVDIAERIESAAKILVWVMNVYGVQESWSVLYTLRLEQLPHHDFISLGLTRNGGTMIDVVYEGELFHVSTHETGRFLIDGLEWGFVDHFVESIVLLGQENAVSY